MQDETKPSVASLFSRLLILTTLWQAAGVISASASAWQTILVHWFPLGREVKERTMAKSTLCDTGNQGESSIRINDDHFTTTINRVGVNRELLGPSLFMKVPSMQNWNQKDDGNLPLSLQRKPSKTS